MSSFMKLFRRLEREPVRRFRSGPAGAGPYRRPLVPFSGQAIPKLGQLRSFVQIEAHRPMNQRKFISPRENAGMAASSMRFDSVWHHACLIDARRPIKSRQF